MKLILAVKALWIVALIAGAAFGEPKYGELVGLTNLVANREQPDIKWVTAPQNELIGDGDLWSVRLMNDSLNKDYEQVELKCRLVGVRRKKK